MFNVRKKTLLVIVLQRTSYTEVNYRKLSWDELIFIKIIYTLYFNFLELPPEVACYDDWVNFRLHFLKSDVYLFPIWRNNLYDLSSNLT